MYESIYVNDNRIVSWLVFILLAFGHDNKSFIKYHVTYNKKKLPYKKILKQQNRIQKKWEIREFEINFSTL